jgi:DNA repair exonuclease SbcCD nuclease subunit
MLKILHTADWHVGLSYDRRFSVENARKLARDRLGVVDRILGLADQFDVHAVLCAGDLFDNPDPGEHWWKGLQLSFQRRKNWTRPVVLLPGNHDPLTRGSVYSTAHPFRRDLPDWVRVVDREDFQLELPHDAVVYASPCTSRAGDKDLALALPARTDGDTRVRIGLVHGSTFDLEGYTTNFPVSREAPRVRGLDYLAIGDTHSFREIPEGAVAPIVYPSAPEPTSFKERDAGYVALVSFTRHGSRPLIQRQPVARWSWRDETVRSMPGLRALAAEDLGSTVLRLTLDLTVTLPEKLELDEIVASLRGTDAANPRTGAFICDDSRVRIDGGEIDLSGLPDVLRATVARLRTDPGASGEAQRALLILQRLLHEVR